ncbi:hypothetical protein MBRA1_001001 [Malassezia brasiliensis]|uniref:Uncharacterized protein n=1 Tax=Malassezia brasiliensis TaxID=1821822 RepID=A0AAF0DRL7_9BASI|nr:hypothetical protein MBRA1_001001 [Malassezia brasiliensis]
MQMEPEKPPSRWESSTDLKPLTDAPGSGAPSVSSTSSQSGASSVFSTQNEDSPLTSLSSQSTSPSLSQFSGKSRRCSEPLAAEDEIHEPTQAPASKKCKLAAPEAPESSALPSNPASKPGLGCGALRMNRAMFVENLVGAYNEYLWVT